MSWSGWLGLLCCGSASYGKLWYGQAGLARLGGVRLGKAWFVSARDGMAGGSWQVRVRHGLVGFGTARQDKARKEKERSW